MNEINPHIINTLNIAYTLLILGTSILAIRGGTYDEIKKRVTRIGWITGSLFIFATLLNITTIFFTEHNENIRETASADQIDQIQKLTEEQSESRRNDDIVKNIMKFESKRQICKQIILIASPFNIIYRRTDKLEYSFDEFLTDAFLEELGDYNIENKIDIDNSEIDKILRFRPATAIGGAKMSEYIAITYNIIEHNADSTLNHAAFSLDRNLISIFTELKNHRVFEFLHSVNFQIEYIKNFLIDGEVVKFFSSDRDIGIMAKEDFIDFVKVMKRLENGLNCFAILDNDAL